MDPAPSPHIFAAFLKKRMLPTIVLIMLFSCTLGGDEHPGLSQRDFRVGETAWVCGCPMMCCNFISRSPGGRCVCNVRSQKGTVVRIEGSKVYVNVSGREKSFTITSR